MGNQTTKPNPTKLYQSQHPVLSCSYPIENTNPLQLFLAISAINKQQYKKWQQKIIMYRALVPILQIQTLYLPIDVQYVEEYLCGNTGVIQARYRASPLLLSEELDNRIKIMQPFLEEQILYLAYIMLYTAQYLHKNNKIIGDVRPKNIFLFEDGHIQLNCLASFQDQISAYPKTLKYKYKTLLAPQQINYLLNNKQNCQDQRQSQNFSIGMTLLGLMLLHDQEMLYDAERNIFDLQGFKKQIELVANCRTYSTVLRKIVIGLLKINIQERLTSNQIFSMLQNYKEDILNLDRIKIDQNTIQDKLRQKLDNINLKKFTKSQINPLSLTFSFGQITSRLKINKNSIIQMLNNDQNKNNSLIINDNLFSNQLFTPSQQQRSSRFDKPNQGMNIKANEKRLEKIQSKQSFQHSMQYENKKLFSRSTLLKSKTQLNHHDKQIYQNNPKPFNLSSMEINARSSNKNLNLNLQYAQEQTSSVCDKYQPSKFSQQNSTPIAKFDNLEDCCLSTKSIKKYNGNKQKDYQKLSDVFKNIDKQLKLSRSMFPNY